MSKNISGEIEFDKMGTCITIIRSITNTNEHRKARESSGGKKRGMPDQRNISPKLETENLLKVLAGKLGNGGLTKNFPKTWHRKARESSGGKKRGMPDEQNIFPKLDAKKRERVLAGKSEECQTNETFPPN
jgi:hypothetical protein